MASREEEYLKRMKALGYAPNLDGMMIRQKERRKRCSF